MSRTVKILLVGDVFLADSPLKTGWGCKSYIENNGSERFIKAINSFTQKCDISFANLECVLSNKSLNIFDISKVEVRGNPEFVEILKNGGFNVLNVANNHIFQHGHHAYLDTLERLKLNGIHYVGNDFENRSNFEIIKCGDSDIGFVGYSLHYEQYRPNEKAPYALRVDSNDIIREIESIRKNFDGYLICSLHWGHEFIDSISIEQKAFCHLLIDSGVNTIVGHHSHVAQGFEVYKDSLILYSLGNFIFDMDFEETKFSYAVEVEVLNNSLVNFQTIPYEIKSDCCPYKLYGSKKEVVTEGLEKMNLKIRSDELLHDFDMFNLGRKSYNYFRNQTYKAFFRCFFKNNLYYNACILLRAILRRLGFIRNP